MLTYIRNINLILWGAPMICLLMGTHIFFTIRLKLIQRDSFYAIKLSITPDSSSEGDLSPFATLATTLAATLGTGNIIGISTAVALGGPGAILWCWLTGLLGMATTYAECYLSILYRRNNSDGNYIGGPMYYLEYGLNSKILAVLFAFFTLCASYGVGCSTQSNSITATTSALWNLPPILVGFIISTLVGLVIIGGVKNIGKVCVSLVPAMSIFYMVGCILLLIINYRYIIEALQLIIYSAFSPHAITGGIIGTTMKTAARYGISRGLFTNEAGLGSAGIAASVSRSSDPITQALVSMTATFWDTVVMCAITGLVIVTNVLRLPSSVVGINPSQYTAAAFRQIPYIGESLLGISLIAFAIATLLGWFFFGERSCEYLFGQKSIPYYQIGYIVMIFLGAIMPLDLVWELSDLFNACMAVPNLLGILSLQRHINIR